MFQQKIMSKDVGKNRHFQKKKEPSPSFLRRKIYRQLKNSRKQ